MDVIGEGKRLSSVRTQEQRTGTPLHVRRLCPGRPYPLGATWDGRGVNFAIYSENAGRVELCLFDSPHADHEAVCLRLPEVTDQILGLPKKSRGEVKRPTDGCRFHRMRRGR